MFDEKKAYNIIYMNLRSSFDIISAIDVKIFDDEIIGYIRHLKETLNIMVTRNYKYEYYLMLLKSNIELFIYDIKKIINNYKIDDDYQKTYLNRIKEDMLYLKSFINKEC